MARLKVLFAGVLFGTAGTAVAFAPASASPTNLGLMRLLIGSISLLALMPKFQVEISNFLKLAKRPLVWVMALCSAAYQPLFFGATQSNGVGISTLLAVGSIPIFAALVGRIFLKEDINLDWLLATFLAILGLTLRTLDELKLENLTGLFMAIGAGASVGCYLNAAKVELKKGANQIALPAMAYLLGSISLIPFLLSPAIVPDPAVVNGIPQLPTSFVSSVPCIFGT